MPVTKDRDRSAQVGYGGGGAGGGDCVGISSGLCDHECQDGYGGGSIACVDGGWVIDPCRPQDNSCRVRGQR